MVRAFSVACPHCGTMSSSPSSTAAANTYCQSHKCPGCHKTMWIEVRNGELYQVSMSLHMPHRP